ncbi:ApeA N-terminal domain 1-containing protein [Subtercola endophyticus]|uniref:ApeA N-terminal domain 1-containing protein n=1 Tax=Subtercola endophyticus TaxID=2895559 RepID=UPI001E310870|nr:hypothetical protein [Subtercola endophyticus]UFS57640.1 hypothetical protein LQ955_11270 [Subtercola endophyticus]
MSIDEFKQDATYSGVLLTFDGAEQHRTAATLRFDADLGVFFEVSDAATGSFFSDDSNHPSVWFRGEAHIPDQCIFESLEGSITLSRIRNTYRSQNFRVSGARFAASEAVLAPTLAAINEPALFDDFVSHFDGLAEWWGARNLVVDHIAYDNGLARRVAITTREDIEPIRWPQNGASMRIELGWLSSSADHGRSQTLAQTTMLISEFPEPRSADEHLTEHWKVKSLMSLVFGIRLAYREHAITSKAAYFAELRSNPAGELEQKYFPRRPFVTRRTSQDFVTPTHQHSDFINPVFWLSEIGPEGLQRWGEAWDGEWERLISPTVSVLSRPRPFIEDVILATGIFLDAWGKEAPRADGEKSTYSKNGNRASPTFATYIFRALTLCGADWSDATTSNIGLSIACRQIYTAVKHAELDQPDPTQMMLISDVLLLLVRMVALRRVDVEGSLVARFGNDWAMKKHLQGFDGVNLVIDENGNFVSKRPDREPEENAE